MKLALFGTAFLCLFALLSATGCSGSDGEIAVEPASTPLDSSPNNPLFTVRLVEARDDGYPLDGLVVKAIPDGKAAIVVAAQPADANGNGKLDEGETIVCTEGAQNVLDGALAGAEVEVEVYAKIDGAETKIGSATWTPPAATTAK